MSEMEQAENSNSKALTKSGERSRVPSILRTYTRRKLQQTLYLGPDLMKVCDSVRVPLGLSRSEFFRYCVLNTLDDLCLLTPVQRKSYSAQMKKDSRS